MNEKLTNFGTAIYNPDEGIYARIKDQEAEITDWGFNFSKLSFRTESPFLLISMMYT